MAINLEMVGVYEMHTLDGGPVLLAVTAFSTLRVLEAMVTSFGRRCETAFGTEISRGMGGLRVTFSRALGASIAVAIPIRVGCLVSSLAGTKGN